MSTIDTESETRATHTKGPLEILGGTLLTDSAGRALARAFESGEAAVEFWETRANARRLVACWNACQGYSTAYLESKGEIAADLLQDDLGQMSQLEECRAHLRDIVNMDLDAPALKRIAQAALRKVQP